MGNKNFVVGLFVAIALAAFITATIWLTGKQASEPTVDYSMYFETDVSGLMLGGPVFYLGVEVGTVTAMTIVPGNPMRVRVDAEVLRSTPVDSGTYGSLALQGITGVAIIRLSADPGIYEPLVKMAGELNPIISVRDTGFSALLSKAPGIVDKMDAVLVQINQILGEDNRAFIKTVLGDLATVSSALADQEQDISEIPQTLNQAMTELHASLLQVKSMAAGLEPDLQLAMGNINQVTDDLANVSARLDSWTADNDNDMNKFMQDGLGQIPALVGDTRRTLRELEKLIKDIRANPSKLIYQPKEDSVDVEQ